MKPVIVSKCSMGNIGTFGSDALKIEFEACGKYSLGDFLTATFEGKEIYFKVLYVEVLPNSDYADVIVVARQIGRCGTMLHEYRSFDICSFIGTQVYHVVDVQEISALNTMTIECAKQGV